jgi:hypothetical protein
MLHAQALVYTADPSGLGERIARDLAATHRTEWAAEAGSVTAADGVCEMHSWPEALRLDAFAASDAALDRVEDLMSEAIAAGSMTAVVEWYRRPSA